MHGWYLSYLMMTLLWKPNSSHSLHVSSRCGDSPNSCGRSHIGLTCSSVSLGIPYINLIKSFYFSFFISLSERSSYGLDTFSSKSLFLMIMGKKTKLVHVQHIASLYSNEEWLINFIMKPCSKDERVNMDTSNDPFVPYFYIHYLVIYELRVMIPLKTFKIVFLTPPNFALSHVTPNAWGILRAFEIVCCSLEISPSIRVFLHFLGTKLLPTNGWVTLNPFPGGWRIILVPTPFFIVFIFPLQGLYFYAPSMTFVTVLNTGVPWGRLLY